VTFDDDDPIPGGGLLSRITSVNVPSNGTYYLAISRYNTDPIDGAGALIWANTPFNVERAPDGPGAGNPWVNYNTGASGTGSYRITLTGACPVSGACPADLDGDGFVDLGDLTILLSNFGGPGTASEGDLDGDGVVALSDLTLLLSAYGSTCP
jgi:hypothetical protein